jgi:hypothetical protein
MYRDDLEATYARAEQLQRELDQAQSQGAHDQQRIAQLTAQLAAMREALARMPQQARMPMQPQWQQFVYPSRGSTVLVLGILSIVLCAFMGPIAWSMGSEELRRIDMGHASPLGRSAATAGRICGIIASALLMLFGGLFVLGMMVAIGSHR